MVTLPAHTKAGYPDPTPHNARCTPNAPMPDGLQARQRRTRRRARHRALFALQCRIRRLADAAASSCRRTDRQAPAHAEQAAPPQLGLPVFRPNRGPQGSLHFDPQDRPRAHERASGPPQFAPPPAPLPATAQRPLDRRQPALTLLLGGEIAWAERDLWINDSSLRPLGRERLRAASAASCRCASDDELLQLASRDIRPHPSVPGALIISATLQNAADFAQPFPVVEITLSDLDEQRIAMRRFRRANTSATRARWPRASPPVPRRRWFSKSPTRARVPSPSSSVSNRSRPIRLVRLSNFLETRTALIKRVPWRYYSRPATRNQEFTWRRHDKNKPRGPDFSECRFSVAR